MLGEKFPIKTALEKGYIDLEDDILFKHKTDVCLCFGLKYEALQQALVKHPFEADKSLWFPRLFSNDDWDNRLVDGGKTIIERREEDNENFIQTYFENFSKYPNKRIVFAGVKDSNGRGYKFVGVFEPNKELSEKEGAIVYQRVETKVKLYPI